MTSPTLSRGLRQYDVGAKLRALRLRKKMRLVELARHTGLSAAMLSKLERGVAFPTLPTLLRVALVFGVGLDHFFTAGATRKMFGIVRARNEPGSPNAWADARWRGNSNASTSPPPNGSSMPTGCASTR